MCKFGSRRQVCAGLFPVRALEFRADKAPAELEAHVTLAADASERRQHQIAGVAPELHGSLDHVELQLPATFPSTSGVGIPSIGIAPVGFVTNVTLMNDASGAQSTRIATAIKGTPNRINISNLDPDNATGSLSLNVEYLHSSTR